MSLRRTEELRVIACLFFILFVGVADNQILSPLLPAIRTQFRKSPAEMGFVFTGYAFCAGLSVLIWGPLSDLFGRKRGLLTGLAVFFAGSCVSYVSSGFYMLLCGRILTGMGASMLSLNTISYAADFFPYAQRGFAMGSIFSSYFAALILGVPLGSWFGDRFGWNAVFGVMSILALVLAFSVHLLLPDLAAKPGASGHKTFSVHVGRYVEFLKSPSSFGALLSSMFASAGTMGFLAFLGVWLHDAFGVSGSRIGMVFLIAGGAALLASPLAGFIADRVGKRLQFVVSSFALALFLLILPRLHWGIPLFTIFGLLSLAAAFRQGPMEAVLTEIVPTVSRGSFVALKNSFSQLGIGVAALCSGILFEVRGYMGVCILGSISCLLAAGAMLGSSRNRDL
jgi:DHA1 family purine base/nucleoside efflux pump-like MFS transporter